MRPMTPKERLRASTASVPSSSMFGAMAPSLGAPPGCAAGSCGVGPALMKAANDRGVAAVLGRGKGADQASARGLAGGPGVGRGDPGQPAGLETLYGTVTAMPGHTPGCPPGTHEWGPNGLCAIDLAGYGCPPGYHEWQEWGSNGLVLCARDTGTNFPLPGDPCTLPSGAQGKVSADGSCYGLPGLAPCPPGMKRNINGKCQKIGGFGPGAGQASARGLAGGPSLGAGPGQSCGATLTGLITCDSGSHCSKPVNGVCVPNLGQVTTNFPPEFEPGIHVGQSCITANGKQGSIQPNGSCQSYLTPDIPLTGYDLTPCPPGRHRVNGQCVRDIRGNRGLTPHQFARGLAGGPGVGRALGMGRAATVGAGAGQACGLSNFATCDDGYHCTDLYDGTCAKDYAAPNDPGGNKPTSWVKLGQPCGIANLASCDEGHCSSAYDGVCVKDTSTDQALPGDCTGTSEHWVTDQGGALGHCECDEGLVRDSNGVCGSQKKEFGNNKENCIQAGMKWNEEAQYCSDTGGPDPNSCKDYENAEQLVMINGVCECKEGLVWDPAGVQDCIPGKKPGGKDPTPPPAKPPPKPTETQTCPDGSIVAKSATCPTKTTNPAPKGGDSGNGMLIGVVALIAAGGLAYALTMKKKGKKR